ncbi:MAG: CBS domain-containing protein [Nitrospinae bacterium]|nr:CBS domain-containing protein [Nitrospinota bacterium]MDA1110629.1 CBS domain-containing protein [Nitrospinota bacterium]
MTRHETHHFSKEHESHLEEIGDYMASPVSSIDHDSTVQEAAQIMQTKHIGSVFVKENDKFVGIITENDLSRKVVAKGLDSETTKVSQIMTEPLVTLDCMEHVAKANQLMAQKKIRHLGITKNGEIIGVLSVKDLVSFYANPRLRTW